MSESGFSWGTQYKIFISESKREAKCEIFNLSSNFRIMAHVPNFPHCVYNSNDSSAAATQIFPAAKTRRPILTFLSVWPVILLMSIFFYHFFQIALFLLPPRFCYQRLVDVTDRLCDVLLVGSLCYLNCTQVFWEYKWVL